MGSKSNIHIHVYVYIPSFSDFLNEQCKEVELKEWEDQRCLQETWTYQGNITRTGMIEDRNSKDLTEAEEIKENTQNSTKKKKS